MIVECPACGTRYDVPEDAIGPAGRKLKCAACGHGWHADAASAVAPEPAAQVEPETPLPPSPRPAPEIAPPLPMPPPSPAPAAAPVAAAEEAPSPFDYEPPFEPRARSGWRWLLWGLAIVALLAVAAALVVSYDPGGIGKRLGLARAGGASPVVITLTVKPTRRAMDSGNEMLAVAGRVSNPTGSAQRVPDIRAELKDARGRTVYGWTIGAPVGRLAPGASADFNSAEIDVPQAARTVHLRQATTSRS